MRENNIAVSSTRLTEYVVDGNSIYLKNSHPPRENPPATAKDADRSNEKGKSKPRSE